jgi:O-methyltransferase domain/Dimerisation domain
MSDNQAGNLSMAPDHDPERSSMALLRLVNGYQVAQAIHVAAVLGIADLLRDGPQSTADLAAATGAHAGALYRVLRALASVGVFREGAERRFALTPLGDCLRSDAPEPVGPWATMIGEDYYWQAWGHLLHSVRTGDNAFRHLQGTDVWTYRASRPQASAVFDRAMTGNAQRVVQAVLAAYDFAQFACVVDVGGGQGAFLGALLRRHPAQRGVLVDQPHVVAGAAGVLRALEVSDRCQLAGGSFFAAVPEGGDAYVLKAILHDWEDEDALAILRVCRRALGPAGTVLVIEQVVGAPNESPTTKFSDLNMLVMPGGRERTREEFAALFSAAGLQVTGVVPTGAGVCVVEGCLA